MDDRTPPSSACQLLGTLPFRAQDWYDPDSNFDVSVWRCSDNLCEMKYESDCDTVAGLYYGSAEDEVTKFCPRHFYEMNIEANGAYYLVDDVRGRARADYDHPQFRRIRLANRLLWAISDHWNEDEVECYPDRLPSFDEYIADVFPPLWEIEWKKPNGRRG